MTSLKDEIKKTINAVSCRQYFEFELGPLPPMNTSGECKTRCPLPGHEDNEPSFSINFFKAQYHCHGCKAGGDIFEFYMSRHNKTFPETLEYFADFLGIDSSVTYKPIPKKKYGKVVKTYHYIDLNDKIIHETCRTENPKNFFQQRPDPKNPKKRISNLNGVTTILYNLKAVVGADAIYIVEGERDVDTLQKLGLVGTCNAQGAGKWPDHLSEWLKGKDIVILPDQDGPGREHAKLVSNKLYDVAKSIKILNLPGLKEGGDVSDWLEMGNTKETLLKLVEDAKPYQDHIDFLNEKHAAIMLSGKFSILNKDYDPVFNRELVTFSSVQDLYYWYGNRKIPNPNAGKKGQKKEISIVSDWMYSSRRREYTGIVFDPEKRTNGVYNLWRGFAYEPKKGNWSLMQDHIRNIIVNGYEPHYKWIITWMARIAQKPGGRRPGTSIVLRGDQGVGKGVFLNNFGKLFGVHYMQANNQRYLTGRFNAHLKDILFLFVDEGFWAGDKSSEGILKGLITEDTISIEQKGRDTFTIKNNVNLAMASNNEWVVPSGMFERRFFVLDVSTKHQQDHKYFKAIKEELNNGGYEAMLYDLLRFDLTTADIQVVPKTEALFDQVLRSLDSIAKFWFACLHEGVIGNSGGWPKYIRNSTIYQCYQSFCADVKERHPTPINQLYKQLRKLAPGIQPTKKYYDSEQHRALSLPCLDVCRKAFQNRVGIEIGWDDDDTSFDNSKTP
jgi:hypothetical protein